MENQINVSTFGPFNLGDLTVGPNDSLFGTTHLENSEEVEGQEE